MKLIIASNNQNKIKEINEVLNNKFNIVSLKDLNYNKEIIEDGSTFMENALIKAKTIYNEFKMPVISDDSGLVVKSLNNLPGVNSKRYSNGNDLDNNLKVLNELKNKNNKDAYFITIIIYYDGEKIKSFEGKLNGTISNTIKGKQGFGYDPIFIPNGYNKTLSELGDDIKNKISHRSIALNKLSNYLLK